MRTPKTAYAPFLRPSPTTTPIQAEPGNPAALRPAPAPPGTCGRNDVTGVPEARTTLPRMSPVCSELLNVSHLALPGGTGESSAGTVGTCGEEAASDGQRHGKQLIEHHCQLGKVGAGRACFRQSPSSPGLKQASLDGEPMDSAVLAETMRVYRRAEPIATGTACRPLCCRPGGGRSSETSAGVGGREPAQAIGVSAFQMYEEAITGWDTDPTLAGVEVHASDGVTFPLALPVWCAPADAVDRLVLEKLLTSVPAGGTVLDVGCGPGRHASYLARSGMSVLGVDVCAAAVTRARTGRVAALQTDVFQPLPAEGRWDAALLLDGNIGLCGDPYALLSVLRGVLAPGGRLLIEVDPENITDRRWLQLCSESRHSAPFRWARLGRTGLRQAAHELGFPVLAEWRLGGRQFGLLAAPELNPAGACDGIQPPGAVHVRGTRR